MTLRDGIKLIRDQCHVSLSLVAVSGVCAVNKSVNENVMREKSL